MVNQCFYFLTLKSLCDPIRSRSKIGQSHPKAMLVETMMGQSPQFYVPTFVEISPQILEKKIFTKYGNGGHPGFVSWIIFENGVTYFSVGLPVKVAFVILQTTDSSIVLLISWPNTYHYENMPMQYTEIVKIVKNENFQ